MRQLALVSLVAACSCASVATQRPVTPFAELQDQPPATSLFPSDAAVLDDSEIDRILEAQVRLPTRVRIALLHLDHRSAGRFYGWYDGGRSATFEVELNPALIETLRSASGIEETSYMPSFLVPERPTVAHLREAAARYQSDLLFVFTSDCQLYQRYRFFSADEAKAYCIADSAILDTRTGIVPFTSRARQEVTLIQQQSDAEFLETLRSAETAALDRAMQENAENLIDFLARAAPSASR